MSTHSEASRLNLEFYRKQAKALLKAAKAADPHAIERITRQSPKFDPATPKLHDAQLAVAREQGFASWPRFRTFVQQHGIDDPELIGRFIDAATSDLRRAEEILAAHPQIAANGFYVALVLGDWRRVQNELAATPSLATGPSGPQNCEPLIYVCFSRFANGSNPRSADLVESARVLLQHGADPNTAFIPEDLPDNPLSCLYAATGLNNNPALGLVLLEAGANPNDSESLYHSTEHPDLACVKLLLRNGATPAGTNSLKHMLDREDLEGLRLLLSAGANPNETNERGETALHWAVWRNRSAEIITALLDSGADVNARRLDGRTAYALAKLSEQIEIATLLEGRGAATDGPPLTAPGSERLLPDLVRAHKVAAVRSLLDAGIPVDTRGEAGGTALHWACWKGYADIVEMVLSQNASLTIEDSEFHATPAGWFVHGLHNCHEDSGDYAAVAHLLIAAGATLPKGDLPTGHPEVDAVLREHGLIP